MLSDPKVDVCRTCDLQLVGQKQATGPFTGFRSGPGGLGCGEGSQVGLSLPPAESGAVFGGSTGTGWN